jgi:PAS domain S-box-containing protein
LLVSVLLMYWVGLDVLPSQRQVASEKAILQHLEASVATLTDAETGQRGYLLTGDEQYLEPYHNALVRIHSEQVALRSLASAGQLPQSGVEALERLVQQKLTELQQTVQLRRTGGLAAALPVVRAGNGKVAMDQIRSQVRRMVDSKESQLQQSLAHAGAAVTLRTAGFIVCIAFNLGVLVWAYWRINREVRARDAADRESSRQRVLLSTTLGSIGDGVIAADLRGRITFINPEAERLTRWARKEALGQGLSEVFRIVNEQTREPVRNPAEEAIRTGKVTGLANHTLLVAKDGTETLIDDSAAPIRMPDGSLCGVVLVFRDFTEQRLAQRTQARLATIVQHSVDAIFAKDLNGVIQTWNASAERLFGYQAEEVIGKPVTILFPPERLGEEDAILARLRKGQRVEGFETIRVAKDGRRIPVYLSVSPIKDSEGAIIGASKIVRDITDLVAAREALVREKELLATTLASIGDAVTATDAEGRVTFLNREAERLTGWNAADAEGRPLAEVFRIINEKSRQPVEDPVGKVIRLGQVVGLANHTLLLARDGREIPIDDSAAPIRHGNGPLFGVVLVFRDFTERKLLEARLEALASFPAQNPEPIMRIAEDGTLLYANPASFTQLPEWKLAVGQAAPTPILPWATEVLRSGRSIQHEVTVTGRTYVVVSVPFRDFGYANLFWNDVTDRKRAEDALRQLIDEQKRAGERLERIVDERTARLREVVTELQHVSYAMVHDMRAPLRAMQGFALILATDAADVNPQQRHEYLQRIITGASRLDKLIQDALNYNRAVLQEMPLQPVALGPLLRGLVETYPNLASVNADIELEAALPTVLGNEALLTQCFSNLLGNAVKFVAPGVRPQVRVWAETREGVARIWVGDNGIGIPEIAQRRLFGMFQKLDREYEGTGAGLAIVRKVIERMGGRVGAESEPGRGSRFWVELPLARVPEDRLMAA